MLKIIFSALGKVVPFGKYYNLDEYFDLEIPCSYPTPSRALGRLLRRNQMQEILYLLGSALCILVGVVIVVLYLADGLARPAQVHASWLLQLLTFLLLCGAGTANARKRQVLDFGKEYNLIPRKPRFRN